MALAVLTNRVNSGLRRFPTWPLYLAAPMLPAWLLYSGLSGALGVDPVKAMEHQMGLWGLQVLIASLLVTPLRTYLGVNLLKFRRALGLIAFFYIALHLAIWLGLDLQFRWDEIWKDILKRPYITIGMAGFAVLIPLALTSWNGAIRRLGGVAWRRLHKLSYVAVAAGGVHYLMVVKGWQLEPILYCVGIAGLLVLRIKGARVKALLGPRADTRNA